MGVAIRDGHSTSYAETVQLWPISEFKNHGAIRDMLLETRVQARQLEEGYWKPLNLDTHPELER